MDDDWWKAFFIAAAAISPMVMAWRINRNNMRASAATNKRLDDIHTSVNGNVTAMMQREFDAMSRELIMMHEIAALKLQVGGFAPSPEAIVAIEATEKKIVELGAVLRERRRQHSKE